MSRRFLTYETEYDNDCVKDGLLDCDKDKSAITVEQVKAEVTEQVETALSKAKESGEFKGTKGDKGDTGAAGKDGTSVTITKTSESDESGGSNVVTFSDGKTLTVKNGKDGTNGTTPVKGVDYFTEADKQELIAVIVAQLSTESTE